MTAPSLTILLFVVLIGVIVLAAAVTIVVLIITRRKPDSNDTESSPAAPSSVAPPDRFAAIGKLHRDRQTGELVLERQGRLYRSADQLAGNGRKELETAARDLQSWLNPSPNPVHAEPEPERPVAPPPAVPVVPVVEPAQAHRPAAAGSMVAQIDEILQEMLATSEHADRSIHLSERPECGVLVWIGAQRYEGIDAVPDEEVKTLLRAAVQEWERRQIV